MTLEKEITIDDETDTSHGLTGFLERARTLTGDGFFEIGVTIIGSAVIVVLALTATVLARGSAPAWQQFGVQFVTGSGWSTSTGAELYGALPYILGTLVTSAI